MITCLNQAVAGNRGLRTLRLDCATSGSPSLVKTCVKVECCTLEDAFQQFSLTKIDYLKMGLRGSGIRDPRERNIKFQTVFAWKLIPLRIDRQRILKSDCVDRASKFGFSTALATRLS